MKEFKIEIPEGYEIDKEKSTFENIVFKKKEEVVNCWEDIKRINGVWIAHLSDIQSYEGVPPYKTNKNVFLNEKYAKSALALAQISQLLPYYDSKVDWGTLDMKWVISREWNNIAIRPYSMAYHVMAFNTRAEAERFLKYNEQLVKDFYML